MIKDKLDFAIEIKTITEKEPEEFILECFNSGLNESYISEFLDTDINLVKSYIESDKTLSKQLKMIKHKLVLEAREYLKNDSKTKTEYAKNLLDNEQKIKVEFIRGDMRTPDEIMITNYGNDSKKPLASLMN